MQNSLIALRVDAIGRKTRWERFMIIPIADRRNRVNAELIQDTNIQNLLQAYLVSDQNVTKLKARLGEAHPDLIGAIDNVAKIQSQLDNQLRGYESSLEMAYKEADARVTELESRLSGHEEASERLVGLEDEQDCFRKERGEIRNRIEMILSTLESLDEGNGE